MKTTAYEKLIATLNNACEPLEKSPLQWTSLLEKIGDARFVLIGEATHGTHEFYEARAEITRQLILNKGFMAVAIEGDWPDAYQINCYLHGKGDRENCEQALNGFKRFPTWMWRNTTLPPFLKWLREHNDHLPSFQSKVGFYGLDLYSLHASMAAVIEYLNKIDPLAAKRAQNRYACFDHFGIDPQQYGYLTSLGLKKKCVEESIEQLLELQHHAFDYVRKDGAIVEDDYFYALQNARLVKNAETYYRIMFEGDVSSWNVRDQHMVETLDNLATHLENRFNKPAKIVVWAHNSHVGDARATEMGSHGEHNVGQLVREQHATAVYLIGFSTYQGWVTAASNWDYPAERKRVNPGLTGSYEELFYHIKHKNFLLHLINNNQLEHLLSPARLQRAIGVIYRPETERMSHYFFTRLPYQFDSLIHLDETTAVKPLDISQQWQQEEWPETYPTGI